MTTILSVEDDAATNNLYASALRLEGFSVMCKPRAISRPFIPFRASFPVLFS
jgi:hypothetical protein